MTDDLRDRLDVIAVPPTLMDMTAAEIVELTSAWESVNPDDGTWDEVSDVARHKLDELLSALRSALGAAVKREAEAGELAKLRADKLTAQFEP